MPIPTMHLASASLALLALIGTPRVAAAERATGITIDPASCTIHRLASGAETTWRIHATDDLDPHKHYRLDLGTGKQLRHYTVVEKNAANRPMRMIQHAPDGTVLAQTILVYNADGTIHQQLRCDADQVLLAAREETSPEAARAPEGF